MNAWGIAMPRRATTAPAGPDPAALALAGVIERYISDQGWSTREAARRWDMNDSTIGKIINDPRRVPRPDTMKKLAAGMGMSLQRLYELCGISDPVSVEESDQQLIRDAIRGMANADLKVLSRLSPEQKAALVAAARALLGSE